MDQTLLLDPRVRDLSSFVAAEHSALTWPTPFLHGTGVPCAGSPVVFALPVLTAQAALGVRSTDLPGFPPRGAPV